MVPRLGYALSSEEHNSLELSDLAGQAEAAGFGFAFISDHYHPWIDRQGQSPFVWGVLGAIAKTTSKLAVGTGVTCPILRIHPAIVAQAAATAQELLGGRFMLGLGTGENLNEHVVGLGWPTIRFRQMMLKEAIDIIKLLFQGGFQSYDGEFYTLEDARLYSLPAKPPPILMAASKQNSAIIAAKETDGLISTSPSRSLVEHFVKNTGTQKPVYGQVAVCYDPDPAKAREIVHEWWPLKSVKGHLHQDLRKPGDYQSVVSLASIEQTTNGVVTGPDREEHLKAINQYFKAGFTHVYVHQIGPNQSAFFRFYEKEILPEFN